MPNILIFTHADTAHLLAVFVDIYQATVTNSDSMQPGANVRRPHC
jgi:hypothetical protein